MPQLSYHHRRQALQSNLKLHDIVFLSAAPVAKRNRDCEYPYRQYSNFHYLTGFDEPQSIMVLTKYKFILFNRVHDNEAEQASGKRAGLEGAIDIYGADEAYDIETFEAKLPDLLAAHNCIYYPMGYDELLEKLILTQFKNMRSRIDRGFFNNKSIHNISPQIHALRQIKDEEELAYLQTAIDITTAGLLRAMRYCQPGQFEYELEAEFMHEFIKKGIRGTAYQNIVAGGANTCIQHYVENDKKIADGDLVLMDIGAENHYYPADITRTFPANGKFTEAQSAIYNIVLAAQEEGMQEVKPGCTWWMIDNAVAVAITRGLLTIGVLHGELEQLIAEEAYKPFYMHAPGHWVGLDVHDVGPYDRLNDTDSFRFKAGMVITVEPGIYISDFIPNVPAKYKNIGVRIEDDLLVTKTGFKLLSANLPRTVAEIEAVMKPAPQNVAFFTPAKRVSAEVATVENPDVRKKRKF